MDTGSEIIVAILECNTPQCVIFQYFASKQQSSLWGNVSSFTPLIMSFYLSFLCFTIWNFYQTDIDLPVSILHTSQLYFLSFPLFPSTPPQYILKEYFNVLFQTCNLISYCVPSVIQDSFWGSIFSFNLEIIFIMFTNCFLYNYNFLFTVADSSLLQVQNPLESL